MSMPYLGEIRLLPYNFSPRGWMDCDGRLLAISTNTALFSLLGTTYGGNGTTTFALPDLRGRIPLHAGQGPGLTFRVQGELAGTETVTLLSQQIPAHTHSAVATTAVASAAAPGPGVLPGTVANQTMYATDLTGATAFTLSPSSTTPAGNSQPHENCMPTLTMRYCIAVEGVFPSRN